jgi:hypothetical protein
LPATLTVAEVMAVLDPMNGPTRLMAPFLYGSGLRLLEERFPSTRISSVRTMTWGGRRSTWRGRKLTWGGTGSTDGATGSTDGGTTLLGAGLSAGPGVVRERALGELPAEDAPLGEVRVHHAG